jgi:hypothetical protein
MQLVRRSALLLVLGLALVASDGSAGRISNPDGSSSLTIKLGQNAQETNAAVQALASYFGYQPAINGVANPETRAQFVDRAVREHVIAWVKEGRAAAAAQAARQTEDVKPLPEVQ